MGDLESIPGPFSGGGGVYAGEGVSNLKHRCHDRKCRIKKIRINILLAVRFLVFYVLT